jgi:RNA polymerase sigma-70 factor (ECF subfamily)
MSETERKGVPDSRAVFLTTHWSLVLAAKGSGSNASGPALEALCQTYWYPLYAYLRRQGRSAHDAQDLTQGFFARLLEKDYLQMAGQEKGKFRTFLLVALQRFVANEWDREHALKRGGHAPVISIDQELAESRFGSEPAHNFRPDILFDRQWAMTLLERAITRLREEYVASGRAALFEHLQSCLAREETALPYVEIAVRLGLTEAAVKMAVHRLRARYREIVREEISHTVCTAGQIEEEIQHLFLAFGT